MHKRGSADRTLKLWDIASGKCLHTFEGHTDMVISVSLSADGRYALSGSKDNTLRLWELEDSRPVDWNEGARPYLEMFLSSHLPYAGTLPPDRELTNKEITFGLTRRGKSNWTEDDFQLLLHTLGCAGYGWLRPEGVRQKLKKMARVWRGSPPFFKWTLTNLLTAVLDRLAAMVLDRWLHDEEINYLPSNFFDD